MRHVLICALIVLGGCGANYGKTSASGEVLSLTPVGSETFAGDYQRLADCVYGRLETAGIRKADFPSTRSVKITMDSGAVRYWELVFASAGPNRTKTDFAVVQTMWGADTLSTRDVMPAVRACAGA